MGVQGSKYCQTCDTYTHWKINRTNCKVCDKPFPAKTEEVKGPRKPTEKELSMTAWEIGYRECPNGHFTAGPRSTVCIHCGEALEGKTKEKEKRVPTTEEINLTTWQHGYRQCNNCNRFTAGPRSLECVHCENIFSKSAVAAQAVKEEETVEEIKVVRFPDSYNYPDGKVRHIYRPAGHCPYNLKFEKGGFPTDEEVIAWGNKVRQTIITERSEFVGNDGLYWWAYQQVNSDNRYKYNSEEMEYLKLLIKTLPDITYRMVTK